MAPTALYSSISLPLTNLLPWMAAAQKKGKYKGEKTLLKGGKYPYTKNGKLDCGRVKNAVARGSQQGVLPQLVKAGIKGKLRACGVTDSKLLKKKK